MGERCVPRRRPGHGRGLDRGLRLARGRWRRLRGRRRVIPLRLGSSRDRRRGDRVGDAASGGSSIGSGPSDGASLGDSKCERPLSRVAPFPSKHASRADGSRSHSFLTICIRTQWLFRTGRRRNRRPAPSVWWEPPSNHRPAQTSLFSIFSSRTPTTSRCQSTKLSQTQRSARTTTSASRLLPQDSPLRERVDSHGILHRQPRQWRHLPQERHLRGRESRLPAIGIQGPRCHHRRRRVRFRERERRRLGGREHIRVGWLGLRLRRWQQRRYCPDRRLLLRRGREGRRRVGGGSRGRRRGCCCYY